MKEIYHIRHKLFDQFKQILSLRIPSLNTFSVVPKVCDFLIQRSAMLNQMKRNVLKVWGISNSNKKRKPMSRSCRLCNKYFHGIGFLYGNLFFIFFQTFFDYVALGFVLSPSQIYLAFDYFIQKLFFTDIMYNVPM